VVVVVVWRLNVEGPQASLTSPGYAGLTLDREVYRLRDTMAARFSDLCYNGFWYSPEMDFILAAVRKSQEVSGRRDAATAPPPAPSPR